MHRVLPFRLAGLGARVAEVEIPHRPQPAGTRRSGVTRAHRRRLDLASGVLIRTFPGPRSSRPDRVAPAHASPR